MAEPEPNQASRKPDPAVVQIRSGSRGSTRDGVPSLYGAVGCKP